MMLTSVVFTLLNEVSEQPAAATRPQDRDFQQCTSGLDRLFRKGDPRGCPTAYTDRIERILDRLDAAARPEDMNLPGFRFHRLKGARADSHSVTVSSNLRITFAFAGEDAIRVDLGDYH